MKESPYRLQRVRVAEVRVLGEIWMPYGAVAATTYALRDYDLENIGDFTRENVEAWLCCNAGDFSKVVDFGATCGEAEIPFADEENEGRWQDATWGDEE